MKNIIIIGAGGFGREVYQWSLDAFDMNTYTIKGFLSKTQNDLDGFDIPVPILGGEDNYNIEQDDVFIIAIGNVEIKRKVIEKLKAKNAVFLTLIHPTAIISSNSQIGEGVVICPYCIVTDNVKIGNYSKLNVYTYCGHDSEVGDHCVLSPYTTLNGGAKLGDGVFAATRSTITAEKLVGDNCIIGAHSIVLHDVADGTKVIGVSKKVVG